MTTTPGIYTYPRHREQHAWVKPSDCPFCAREDFTRTQQIAAAEAARDQALAAKRDDNHAGSRAVAVAPTPVHVPAPESSRETGGARALVLFLLILTTLATAIPGAFNAWAWFTNLGQPTIHHFAWLPLLAVTALCVAGIRRLGRN